jgi:hypothetical protein
MSLEIIGPAFGRTGTNSLKIALEHLGFGPCHHMFEVRDNPELLPDWEAAARGEQIDWGKVFRSYRSQVDWPGARYWRELARHFPEASGATPTVGTPALARDGAPSASAPPGRRVSSVCI